MQFSPEQIIDRYKLKSQISSWRLIALIILALLLWTMFDGRKSTGQNKVYGRQYIGRVFINGVILDEFERVESLKKIANDKDVKALIVHINSPGGSFVGGQNLYYALKKVATKKPVVAVMGEMATSGGYMAALGADYIFAREGTLTGSIGVIINSFEATELAEKLGIKLQILKSSIYKASPNPLEKLQPEAKLAIEDTIMDSYKVFALMVKERRGIPSEKLASIANGRVYTGKQAFELGLIDAFGGEDEAKEWLVKDKKVKAEVDIKDIPLNKPISKFDRFFEATSQISALIKLCLNSLILY
jgi:protease-4